MLMKKLTDRTTLIGKTRAISRDLTAALLMALVLAACAGFSSPALADNYSRGIALFKGKDYKNAEVLLHKATFERPGDANCAYYYALACHYAKDFKNAQVGYLEVMQKYPQSGAAVSAQRALATLAPGLIDSVTASPGASSGGGRRVTSYSGSSSSGSSTGGDIIPTSSIVNFDLENNHMVVDAAFNGHHTKVIFDTGAEMILLGKNHLEQMGLPIPRNGTRARSRGVDGRIVDVLGEPMDVTVGGVTRRNIMVYVQDSMDTMPLLGLPFVHGMNYAVENNAIRFNAKSSMASSSRGSDYNAVPYSLQGRTMVVVVKVNGRDTQMCLDTGAACTLFTKSQAAAIGINVSDEPEVNLGSGVGGAVNGHYATVNSIILGPVRQSNFRIGVSDANHSPYPLLGKDFWEGHRYSVDEDKHLIHWN